jgi:hypothetical protein
MTRLISNCILMGTILFFTILPTASKAEQVPLTMYLSVSTETVPPGFLEPVKSPVKPSVKKVSLKNRILFWALKHRLLKKAKETGEDQKNVLGWSSVGLAVLGIVLLVLAGSGAFALTVGGLAGIAAVFVAGLVTGIMSANRKKSKNFPAIAGISLNTAGLVTLVIAALLVAAFVSSLKSCN